MKIRIVKARRRPPWPAWAVIVTGVWLGMIGLLVLLMRIRHLDFRICIFHRLTGWPCPSCGMTRGVLAALAGRPIEGWLCNPLFFTLLAIFAADALGRVLLARRVRFNLTRGQRRLVWWAFLGLLLLNWAYLIRYVG